MKSIVRFLTAAILAASVSVLAQEQDEQLDETAEPAIQEEKAEETFSLKERDLIRDLARELTTALRESNLPAETPLVILPVVDDRADYAYGLFKIAVTDAGRNCVEGRKDQMWTNIVEETAWTQRKGAVGVLDEATLTKFGKLQAANLLLYGNVRATVKPVFFGLVKLTRIESELHVSSVQTKQHLWGKTFVQQQQIPWILIGVIALVVLIILKIFISAMTRAR